MVGAQRSSGFHVAAARSSDRMTLRATRARLACVIAVVAGALFGLAPSVGHEEHLSHTASVDRLDTPRALAVGIVDGEAFCYVLGNVTHPGRYTWKNGLTVEDAIIAAGGLTARGAFSDITLTRKIDGQETTRHAELSELLEANDIVRVQ
jgi:hypothetical protein